MVLFVAISESPNEAIRLEIVLAVTSSSANAHASSRAAGGRRPRGWFAVCATAPARPRGRRG